MVQIREGHPVNAPLQCGEVGGEHIADLSGIMVKETILGRPYKIYKNSPNCPVCDRPMRYLYTHLASNRSVWKCRECNKETITHGYPEEDEGDPSKRSTKLNMFICYAPFGVPGVGYGNRGIREDNFFLQDCETEVSGRGYREQISTIYALHV